jgi:hypothetical protein
MRRVGRLSFKQRQVARSDNNQADGVSQDQHDRPKSAANRSLMILVLPRHAICLATWVRAESRDFVRSPWRPRIPEERVADASDAERPAFFKRRYRGLPLLDHVDRDRRLAREAPDLLPGLGRVGENHVGTGRPIKIAPPNGFIDAAVAIASDRWFLTCRDVYSSLVAAT